MKINYLILENFSNIDTAMNAHKIKLDFTKATNKIILLVGKNGSGKTSILSLLTPFATIGGLDVRNSSNLIMEGKNGYKEIEIVNQNHTYLIKHFYTPKKPDGHSVKSYIEKDGTELNPNGNVTSFKEWVKEELRVELDYLKLIRLGSNVTSMIDLSETERKTFMNKLMEDMDVYLTFFKKTNNDLKQLKELTSHAIDKQNRLGIQSVEDVKEEIQHFEMQMEMKQREYDKIAGQISIAQHILDEIDEKETLKIRLTNVDKTVHKMRRILEKKEYENTDPSYYLKQLDELQTDITSRQTKIEAAKSIIHSYLVRLDELNEQKRNMEVQYIKEKETDTEFQSMEQEIEKVTRDIANIKKGITQPKPDISKDDFDNFVVFLKNTQQQLSKTYEFGKEPVKKVASLLRKGKNVLQYINNHMHNLQSSENTDILIQRLKTKFDFVEKDIPDSCKDVNCKARRAYTMIGNLIHGEEDKTKETMSMLQTMEVVYQNLMMILTEFSSYAWLIQKLPEALKKDFLLDTVYQNIEECGTIYNENKINELLSLITEYYNIEVLEEKRVSMESVLKKFRHLSNLEYIESQLDTIMLDIEMYSEKITDLKQQIHADEEIIDHNKKTMEVSQELYDTFTKYDELEEEKKRLTDEWNRYLKASTTMKDSSNELHKVKLEMDYLSGKIQDMKLSIIQYKEIQKDLNTYSKVFDEMTLIKESLSSNKGIPLRYVKNYLGNTVEITNELLDIVYDGTIYIDKFKIAQNEFTIPFYNKGKVLRDVKLASQGERSFISIALAFALSSQTMKDYNIMLLDEMDSTLDIRSKEKFLKILENQIDRIHAEQCFFITHSNMFSSYPVDVINFGKDDDEYIGTIPIEKS